MVSISKQQQRQRRRVRGHQNQQRRTILLILFSCIIIICVSYCILWLVNRDENAAAADVTTSIQQKKRSLVRRGGGVGSLQQPDMEIDEQEEETTAADDESSPNNKKIIHIVHTRFMQEQGHLLHLSRARLLLFTTFCLPTMLHQTNQNYLWIIKTDPKLHNTIRESLISLLQPYSHYFLIPSNVNFAANEQKGSWKTGEEGQEILYSSNTTTIYTGNVSLLEQAHAQRLSHMVLETRLDADDGLHKEWIQVIQQHATKELQHFYKNWMYWCVQHHVEWYTTDRNSFGILNIVSHSKLCVTPGLTVGYAATTTHEEEEVPTYPHDVLYKSVAKYGGCRHNNEDSSSAATSCIRLLDQPYLAAIRSRTPTSAGMLDSSWNETNNRKVPQDKLWAILQNDFFISQQQQVHTTNSYIQEHSLEIAQDNLLGQCTTGHSCKNTTKELLQKLIIAEQQKEKE